MISKKKVYKLLIITIIASSVITWFINNFVFYHVADPLIHKFRTVANILQRYDINVENINNLEQNAFSGMIKTSEDSENKYLDASMTKEVQFHPDSQLLKLGVRVSKIIDGFIIVDIYNRELYEKHILNIGDTITSINGESAHSLWEINSKIINGTNEFEVIDKESNEIRKISLNYEKEHVFNPILSFLNINNTNIAILSLQNFDENIIYNLEKSINEIRNCDSIQKIIIDLRNNRDFILSNATSVTEKLVSNKKKDNKKKSPYLYIQTKEQYLQEKCDMMKGTLDKKEKYLTKYFSDNDEFVFNKTTEILINENTYTSGQIIASSLNLLDGISIIGTEPKIRPFIDDIVPLLFDNTSIKIPTHKWYNADMKPLSIMNNIKPTIFREDNIFFKLKNISAIKEYSEGDIDDTFVLQTIYNTKKIMNSLGYHIDNLDSIFDHQLTEKITQFQINNNLSVSKKIDFAFLKCINGYILGENKNIYNDKVFTNTN